MAVAHVEQPASSSERSSRPEALFALPNIVPTLDDTLRTKYLYSKRNRTSFLSRRGARKEEALEVKEREESHVKKEMKKKKKRPATNSRFKYQLLHCRVFVIFIPDVLFSLRPPARVRALFIWFHIYTHGTRFKEKVTLKHARLNHNW